MHTLIAQVLQPVRVGVEAVLVEAYDLTGRLGAPLPGGVRWLLAVAALMVLLRLLVLPLVIAAARNAQGMALLTGAVAQARAGARPSRDVIRALRRRSTARQWKTLVPQLLQLPVFLAFSVVLQQADAGRGGAGPLTAALARSFSDATLLGAGFRTSVLGTAAARPGAIVVGTAVALIAGAAVFAGQAVTLRFSITDAARLAPVWRFRPTPLFVAPPVVVLVSLTMPLGLGLYLALSSTWALQQQLFLLHRYPLPTSLAALHQVARATA